MRSRFCFVFVVVYLTAVLIFTVYLRNANNRIFYKLHTYKAEVSQLKQQLNSKQLQLESLINPAAISQRLGESSPMTEPRHQTDRKPGNKP